MSSLPRVKRATLTEPTNPSRVEHEQDRDREAVSVDRRLERHARRRRSRRARRARPPGRGSSGRGSSGRPQQTAATASIATQTRSTTVIGCLPEPERRRSSRWSSCAPRAPDDPRPPGRARSAGSAPRRPGRPSVEHVQEQRVGRAPRLDDEAAGDQGDHLGDDGQHEVGRRCAGRPRSRRCAAGAAAAAPRGSTWTLDTTTSAANQRPATAAQRPDPRRSGAAAAAGRPRRRRWRRRAPRRRCRGEVAPQRHPDHGEPDDHGELEPTAARAGPAGRVGAGLRRRLIRRPPSSTALR